MPSIKVIKLSINKDTNISSILILISGYTVPANILTLGTVHLHYKFHKSFTAKFVVTLDNSKRLTIFLKRHVCAPIATGIEKATCLYVVKEEVLSSIGRKRKVIFICHSFTKGDFLLIKLCFCLTHKLINTRDTAQIVVRLVVIRLGIRIDCDGSHGKDSECLCYASALDASHHRIQKFGNLFHFGKI